MNNAEKMMRENPFPEYGNELNKKYILAYQSTNDENVKHYIWDKMIKLNIRLVGRVHKHHNYYKFMTEDQLLSLYCTAVKSTLENFDKQYFGNHNSVANHIIINLRSQVGKWVHEDSNIIHLPANKRNSTATKEGDVNFKHLDIDEFSEIIGYDDSEFMTSDFVERFLTAFEKILETDQERRGFEYFRMSLDYDNFQQIAVEKYGEVRQTVVSRINRIVKKMRLFARHEWKEDK